MADADRTAVRLHGTCSRPAIRWSACGSRTSGNTAVARTGYNYYGQYHPEDEVEAQWFGRGGVEPVLGNAYNSYLTFMGPLTTGLGGPYAGFGTYAQGC